MDILGGGGVDMNIDVIHVAGCVCVCLSYDVHHVITIACLFT